MGPRQTGNRILETEGPGQKTELSASQGVAGYLTPRMWKGEHPWGKQGPKQPEGQIELTDRQAQGSLLQSDSAGGRQQEVRLVQPQIKPKGKTSN